MKTLFLRSHVLLLMLVLFSFTVKAQGTVNVSIAEENTDPSTKDGVPYITYAKPHCPGDVVKYNVYGDHYDIFKIRVFVTNGVISNYIHTSNSQLISPTEVLLQPEDGAMGYDDGQFQVTWSTSAGAVGNLHAVVYYHYFGFLFTQQADGYRDQLLGLAPPIASSSLYSICAGNSTSVSVNPVSQAIGYTWSSSNSGISVNNGQTATGSATSVTVNVSPSLSPGTYSISVSPIRSAGQCPITASTTIPIVVSNVSPTAPTSARFVASGPTCSRQYNLVTAVIPNATSYYASSTDGGSDYGTVNLTSNTVTFFLGSMGPITGLQATITASNGCGSASYTTPPFNVPGPPISCGKQPLRTAAFPNPANDQLTIEVGSQDAQATLYDEQSVSRKVIHLHAESEQTVINTRDLPNGVYHLRIITKGQSSFEKRIIVQH
jgi:hypothetical protein